MWVFDSATGRLWDRYGTLRAIGYSGYDDGDGIPEPGEGKNDPSKEGVRSVGPLPRGTYRFKSPFTHPTAGPYTMRLFPMYLRQDYGRSGFLIHGDSLKRPGSASQGCMVFSRPVRQSMWESLDHEVMVISTIETVTVVT